MILVFMKRYWYICTIFMLLTPIQIMTYLYSWTWNHIPFVVTELLLVIFVFMNMKPFFICNHWVVIGDIYIHEHKIIFYVLSQSCYWGYLYSWTWNHILFVVTELLLVIFVFMNTKPYFMFCHRVVIGVICIYEPKTIFYLWSHSC